MQEILHLDPNDATRFVELVIITTSGAPATGLDGQTARLFVNGAQGAGLVTGVLAHVGPSDAAGVYRCPLTLANITGMMPNDKGTVFFDDGAGATLPAVADFVIVPNPYATLGTAAGGTVNTVVLAATASATDDAYNDLVFEALEPVPFMRFIDDYVGATKIATFNAPVGTAPGATTKYVIWKEPPQRDGIADLLATVPAGSASTLSQIFARIGAIALDVNGAVTVGSIAQGAADFIIDRAEAAGRVLSRITQAITDKLTLFAVEAGTGKVTTTNPGGLTPAQDVLLTQIGTDTADIRARFTVEISDKLGRFAVSIDGAVSASNVEASGLTQVQDDRLNAAATNTDALVQRVTQGVIDHLNALQIGNDGSVLVGGYSQAGATSLGLVLTANPPVIPAFPVVPTADQIGLNVEGRANAFADALLNRVNGIAEGVSPKAALRGLFVTAAFGGKLTGVDGTTNPNDVSVFSTKNVAVLLVPGVDRYGNRPVTPQWNVAALTLDANW